MSVLSPIISSTIFRQTYSLFLLNQVRYLAAAYSSLGRRCLGRFTAESNMISASSWILVRSSLLVKSESISSYNNLALVYTYPCPKRKNIIIIDLASY